MIYAYLILLVLGIILFAMRRMNTNIWWVAFFSTAIYAIPVAFGYDLFGRTLKPETSLCMIIVLVACLLAASFSRVQVVDRNEGLDAANIDHIFYVSLLVCLASFALLLMLYGTEVFHTHKTESGIGGYFYIFWRLAASFGVLTCVLARRWKLLSLAMIPLGSTLLAGDRTAVGLTTIGALWIILQYSKLAAPRQLALAIPVCALGLFLFFGKVFQAQLYTDTFVSFSALAGTVAAGGVGSIVRSEPFATIGVLNALIDFQMTPPAPLLLEVAAQFLVVPSAFGFDSNSFNDFFQPILFPGYRENSLAYSFWGEGYLRGGWLGYSGFLLIYLGVLALFDRLSRKTSGMARLFAYTGGAYWAFYIHRNSLVSILAYERQIVIFLGVLMLAGLVFRQVNRRVNLARH